MPDNQKFGLLRRMLQGLGLSQQKSDAAVDYVVTLLEEDSDKIPNPQAPKLPYHLRDHFLSPAELKFYKILRRIARNRAHLVTKVNLNDIFYVKDSNFSQYRTYTNKIDRKHVDFLLCDWNTLQPILGIELDDRSHQRKDRQERDTFVDSVFEAANLPILHVKVKREYDIKEIARTLTPYLNFQSKEQPKREPLDIPATVGVNASPSHHDVKICPRCGAEMVLRTAQKGENAGNQFWGCSAYPKCRAIEDVV